MSQSRKKGTKYFAYNVRSTVGTDEVPIWTGVACLVLYENRPLKLFKKLDPSLKPPEYRYRQRSNHTYQEIMDRVRKNMILQKPKN